MLVVAAGPPRYHIIHSERGNPAASASAASMPSDGESPGSMTRPPPPHRQPLRRRRASHAVGRRGRAPSHARRDHPGAVRAPRGSPRAVLASRHPRDTAADAGGGAHRAPRLHLFQSHEAPHSILVGPEPAHGCLVDDGHASRRIDVGCHEVAPVQEAHADRAEAEHDGAARDIGTRTATCCTSRGAPVVTSCVWNAPPIAQCAVFPSASAGGLRDHSQPLTRRCTRRSLPSQRTETGPSRASVRR